MLDHQIGARRTAPVFIDAVTRPAEDVRSTIKRVRHKRAHGYFVLIDGTSKPWFNEPTRDLMRLLAVDPTVRSFEPRPTCFGLSIDGTAIDHTPDFRVTRATETAIVDIIRARKQDDDERRADVPDAMCQVCGRWGFQYYRIRLEEIYAQPRYDNACELLRFKSADPSPEFAFQVEGLLSQTGGVSTRGQVEDALGGRDMVVPNLYAMALRRIVGLEQGKPLSRDSRLWLLARDAGR